MNKGTGKRNVIEMGKNVLIVALICSALWLVGRNQLFRPLEEFFKPDSGQTGLTQPPNLTQAEAVYPLRMTANLFMGTETLRYGSQYDAQATDALFQKVAGLLVETLSSVGPPEKITQAQWEEALLHAPGVSLDFQGYLPMPVLVGWLTGEATDLTGTVRRVTLTMVNGVVAMCYRDEDSGSYYRCRSEVASEQSLTAALSTLGDNGAYYAFESEAYQVLDPYTLVMEEAASSPIYVVTTPMSEGRSALEELMDDLNLPISGSNFYPAGEEEVVRTGDETLRLSAKGVASYLAGESGNGYFPITSRRDGPTLLESVEACRKIAAQTIGVRCGQARFYLLGAQETSEGLSVQFGYSLNGAQVRLEDGPAASFLIHDGVITKFTLRFRSYTATEEPSVIMPIRQAAAAMEAMALQGEELLLVYYDTDKELVSASWGARDMTTAGEG